MNANIKKLFFDYLELTDDKPAAASLVLADAFFADHTLPSPPEPVQQPKSENLSVSEAAKHLNCSPATIYRLCAIGKLPHCRVGAGRGVIRIRRADFAVCQQICSCLPTDMSAKRRRYLGV